MNNAIAKRPSVEFALSLLNGPDKGATYKMVSNQITIGRMPENDIALVNDTKCSRQHAVIHLTSGGVEIRNVSERNEVFVNGQSIAIAILQPKDVIKIGKTKFQFRVLGLAEDKAPALSPVGHHQASSSPPSHRKSKTDSKLNLYIMTALLIGGMAWLLNSDGVSKKAKTDFRTDADSKNQVEENRLFVDQMDKTRREKGYDSQQFEQAQANYIKGFRDYQKGQYQRARDYFQTCLSLFPAHQLCNQYYRESQNKFRELVQYYLTLGKEYSKKGQYKACMSAYTNVKVMEPDKGSTQFQEADSGYSACASRDRGLY
jgi:tetratricopeptide (TPR) repeat protein